MQILKPLLISCLAVCALSARGADNEKQAKAREALEKLQGGTPLSAKATATSQPQAAPPPAQPAIQSTWPAAAPADSQAIVKAREAMRLKMQEAAASAPPQAAPAVPPTAPVATQAPPPTLQSTSSAADPAAPQAIDKAREAMRLKMQDVVAQDPPPPAPAVPPATPAATQVPPPPAPVPPPPPVVATPTVQPPVQPAFATAEEADPAAIAKAREALRLKMQQLEAEQPAPPVVPPGAPPVVKTVPPPPPPPTQVPPAARPAPPAPPTEISATPAVAAPQTPLLPDLVETPGADQASIEKAREAMRLRMQTLPASAQEAQAGEAQSYLHHAEPITAKSFPPLAGPALPISVDKQQRLEGLLLRYKTDQITPEQYQAERARILAQQ